MEDSTLQVSERQVEELANAVEQLEELIASGPATERLAELHSRLERAVWRMQLGSLSPLEKQFEKAALELAERLKKQVRWECAGFDVDIPVSARDALSTALVHAIRNSIDHGIEFPSERITSGKAAAGRIRVRAEAQGARLKVSVRDDGRGPALAKIVQRGVDLNLVPPDRAQTLSVEEKLELLFQPGFSTRERVSELSGRGIGLDAVRASVQELGGDVSAREAPGGGFELVLSLPLVALGAEVVPAKFGPYTFWLQRSRFEIREIGPGGAKPDADPAAQRLTALLGLPSPSGRFQVRSLRDDTSYPSVALRADEVGQPEYRFFRRLDPIWKAAGPPWLRKWLEAGEGVALACRAFVAGAPGEPASSSLTMFTDPYLLAQALKG